MFYLHGSTFRKTDTRDPGSEAEKPIASHTYVPLCSTFIILNTLAFEVMNNN